MPRPGCRIGAADVDGLESEVRDEHGDDRLRLGVVAAVHEWSRASSAACRA
jgi:hypothetical protein